MKRLAHVLLAALVVLLVLGPAALLSGCASSPPPVLLGPVYAQANAVGADLDKANRDHEQQVKDQLVELVRASCPSTQPELRRCARAIATQVVETAAWRDTLLLSLTAHHRDARDALKAAEACRAQGDEGCVVKKREEAATHLDHVESELRTKP